MEKKLLKGITWGHSRTITTLLAGAQRCNGLHPDAEITYGTMHQNSFVKFEGTKGAIQTKLGLLMDYPKGYLINLSISLLKMAQSPTG